MKDAAGNRVRWFRKRWNLTTDELAHKAGVDPETLNRIEDGTIRPSETEAERLAVTLCIDAEWVLTGQGSPILLGHMTQGEQIRTQSGPGTEGLPGFVVTRGGPWYRDEHGRWRISTTHERND